MSTITPRYFLKKSQRLKSRKAIETIFAKGKSYVCYPLRVAWININPGEDIQAGFGVSSKNFRKATDRNLVKRKLREAYRLQQFLITGEARNKQVFFMYTGKKTPVYTEIFSAMQDCLHHLQKK